MSHLTPHPFATILRAIAAGEPIQYRYTGAPGGEKVWTDAASADDALQRVLNVSRQTTGYDEYEFRAKPCTINAPYIAGEPHCSGLGSQELRAFAAEMGYIIDGPVYPPYSRDWAIGGPIIDRLGISITQCGGAWKASTTYQSAVIGPTHLIAAMRCHVGRKMGIGVGSRMGMQIHVPASLLQAK